SDGNVLGDASSAPFRSRIGHAPGSAAHAERAPDIDDLAVALRDHGRNDGPHGIEAAGHVDGDDFVEFLARCLPPALSNWPGTAGNIHDHVDPAEGGTGQVRGSQALRFISDVALDDGHLSATLFRFLRHSLDCDQIAPCEREPATFGGEGETYSHTHPLGGTSNDDTPSPQTQIHH